VPVSFPLELKGIIEGSFHLHIDENNRLDLREEQVDAKCRWVNIQLKNSLSTFAFSIDVPRKTNEKDPVFSFFNVEKEGLCSKNDAILVCQRENKIHVFLIELKSINKGKYLKQLNSSKVLFEFIVDRMKLINIPVNKDQIEYRGILFCCPRRGAEEPTRKKFKASFDDRNGLQVTEMYCHNTYRIQQFLP